MSAGWDGVISVWGFFGWACIYVGVDITVCIFRVGIFVWGSLYHWRTLARYPEVTGENIWEMQLRNINTETIDNNVCWEPLERRRETIYIYRAKKEKLQIFCETWCKNLHIDKCNVLEHIWKRFCRSCIESLTLIVHTYVPIILPLLSWYFFKNCPRNRVNRN